MLIYFYDFDGEQEDQGVGILCVAGAGAVFPPPPFAVRPALLRKTLMQTQIVTHTQPQAQACLPGGWFDLLVGSKQLESGRVDLDLAVEI